MRRSLLATGMACAVAERALAMTIPLAAAHQGPPPRCAVLAQSSSIRTARR
jgi:hypothetical protein